jgi:hypothetical protein
LLLVNDLSNYMCVATIPSNEHAVPNIMDIQAWAEGESSLKLRALFTDHAGEFTAIEFVEYYMTGGMYHQHTTPYSPL